MRYCKGRRRLARIRYAGWHTWGKIHLAWSGRAELAPHWPTAADPDLLRDDSHFQQRGTACAPRSAVPSPLVRSHFRGSEARKPG